MPDPGRLTQEAEHLGVELLGDLRGSRIVVGSGCPFAAGDDGHEGRADG
jgi:hypothetical protein